MCALKEDTREAGKQEHRLRVHVSSPSDGLFLTAECLGLACGPLSALRLLGKSDLVNLHLRLLVVRILF